MADTFVNRVSEATGGNEFATELAEEMSDEIAEAVVAEAEAQLREQADNALILAEDWIEG